MIASNIFELVTKSTLLVPVMASPNFLFLYPLKLPKDHYFSSYFQSTAFFLSKGYLVGLSPPHPLIDTSSVNLLPLIGLGLFDAASLLCLHNFMFPFQYLCGFICALLVVIDSLVRRFKVASEFNCLLAIRSF